MHGSRCNGCRHSRDRRRCRRRIAAVMWMAGRSAWHNQFNVVEFAVHHTVGGWHKAIARGSVSSEGKRKFAFAAGEITFPQNRGLPNRDAIDGGQRARRRRTQ